MKVLCAVPRYETCLSAAEDWQIETLVALAQAGHTGDRVRGQEIRRLFIEDARQVVCERAVEGGFDVALMLDADCWIGPREAVALAEECVAGDWALLGAPIAMRVEHAPNFRLGRTPKVSDAPAGELVAYVRAMLERRPLALNWYMGTGSCAVGVKHLADIPRPWWRRPLEGPGGVDVAFSERTLSAGKKIGVHLGLRSGAHFEMRAVPSDWMLRQFAAEVLDILQKKHGVTFSASERKALTEDPGAA